MNISFINVVVNFESSKLFQKLDMNVTSVQVDNQMNEKYSTVLYSPYKQKESFFRIHCEREINQQNKLNFGIFTISLADIFIQSETSFLTIMLYNLINLVEFIENLSSSNSNLEVDYVNQDQSHGELFIKNFLSIYRF